MEQFYPGLRIGELRPHVREDGRCQLRSGLSYGIASETSKELRALDTDYANDSENLTYLERRNELEQHMHKIENSRTAPAVLFIIYITTLKGGKHMINYFKMKRNEWKVKAQLYGLLAYVIDNQKDIITSLEKLFVALKDDAQEKSSQTTPSQASETTE